MLSLCARDIMTRDVVTARKGTSIEEAMRLMAKHQVSGLPVVDTEGCLVGIITESDVLLKGLHAPSEMRVEVGLFAPEPDAVDDAYRRAQSQCVEDAMTKKVVAFMENSLVVDIARAMIERAVNRVPIVDGCKVVGIVSRRDVIRAMSKAVHPTGDYDADEVRVGKVIEL